MLTIRQRRLCVEVPSALIKVIFDNLKEQYDWFITSLKQEYLSKLNIEIHGNKENEQLINSLIPYKTKLSLAGGDFAINKKGDLYYIKIPLDRSYLECGCILKSNGLPDFTAFCDSVKQIISKNVDTSKTDWEEVNVLDKTTKEYLSQSCEQFQPANDEIEATRELEQASTRLLLSRILTSPDGSFLNAFTDLMPQKDLAETMDRLERFKLVTKSYVVLCRERNREIIKVNTRDAIDDASRRGLKCSMCGRPISDEHIDELLAATPTALKLVSQHYWMPIRVIDQLMALGVSNEDIHVEFQENSFVSLYLECGNQVLLLSLIDRPMTLQDAQFLIASIGVHKAKNTVLVSTERIPTLLKTYLKQFNPKTTIFFIDSYVRLQKRLPKILEEILEEQISNITEDFIWLTPVNIQELVVKRLFPQDAEQIETEQESETGNAKRQTQKETESPKREKGRKSQKERQEEEIQQDEVLSIPQGLP